jgi:hypothetical protein
MAKIVIVEHATRIASLLCYRYSFMMTGTELHISAFHSSSTRQRTIITLWLVRQTKRTGPSSEISCRHVDHVYCHCNCGFKTRAIQKELGYKNADKASKLAPLETESTK